MMGPIGSFYSCMRHTGFHKLTVVNGPLRSGCHSIYIYIYICFVLISMPNSIPKRRNYGRLAL